MRANPPWLLSAANISSCSGGILPPYPTLVRLSALHILPTGLMKIRHYGWMCPNSKVKLEEVKLLVWLFLSWTYWLAHGHAPQPEPLTAPLHCRECGGTKQVIAVTYESLEMSRGPPGVTIDSG